MKHGSNLFCGGVLMATMISAGCRSIVNPSFAVTTDEADRALSQMADSPKEQSRPLVIVGGFADPGVGPWFVQERYARAFESPKIVTLTSTFGSNMLECRSRVIEAVDKAFPTNDPSQTVELDVIGLSMGGLVSRYAAAPVEGKRRLRVARLFTISSPHSGARLAQVPTWDDKVLQMREGSSFLHDLATLDAQATYELYCYTRLNDSTVGERLAAPPGRVAWWVDTPAGQTSHMGAALDPRIIADILRRLRGEASFTTDPPSPVPTK